MKIEWLDNAREDMFAIYARYDKNSHKAAVKIYNGIIDDVSRLESNPRLGHVEPLLEAMEYEFRTIISSNRTFKLIYFIDDDTIFVSRIWDCRQNPTNLKRGAF